MKAVALASAVAICLAGEPAWGHRFPSSRNVVIQVERCEVALLIGYRPGTGEPTESILARVASAPKSHAFEAMRDVLTAYALRPLTVAVDGRPLVPAGVRAKIGLEPGGARPMVVLLVTFPLPAGATLSVTAHDPPSTRISWQDQASGRVVIPEAPAQGKWHAGVASFLLKLTLPKGGTACGTRSTPSDSDSDSSPAR